MPQGRRMSALLIKYCGKSFLKFAAYFLRTKDFAPLMAINYIVGLKTDILTRCTLNLCESTNVHIPNFGNQIVHISLITLIREKRCALGNHSRLTVGEEAFSSFFNSKTDKPSCLFVLYISNKQYFVHCNSLRLPRWRASCPLKLFLRRDLLHCVDSRVQIIPPPQRLTSVIRSWDLAILHTFCHLTACWQKNNDNKGYGKTTTTNRDPVKNYLADLFR